MSDDAVVEGGEGVVVDSAVELEMLEQNEQRGDSDAERGDRPVGSQRALHNRDVSERSQSQANISFYLDICKSSTFQRFVILALFLINLNAIFR